MQNKADARHESLKRLLAAAKEVEGVVGPAALAATLVESEQTITNWAKRGVSKAGAMKAQAAFGCSANWVLHGTPPRFIQTDSETATQAQQLRAQYKVTEIDLVIPQYAAGGAMGNGLILEERQPGIIKSWSVDHEWLRLNVRHHTGVQNLCIVTGFGPSMQPKYNPGDPLLLDRGVNTVETEGIFFFRVGKHGYIKQLQRIPTEDGLIIRAKSLNTSYDPFDITARMDFEVFGKVLTVWRSERV